MPTDQSATIPLGRWYRVGGWLICPVETSTAGVTFKWKQATKRVQERAKRRERKGVDVRTDGANNSST